MNKLTLKDAVRIEDFIKHSPHCLVGKYSTMGRCSCGAFAALEELAEFRSRPTQRAVDLRQLWRVRLGHGWLSSLP